MLKIGLTVITAVALLASCSKHEGVKSAEYYQARGYEAQAVLTKCNTPQAKTAASQSECLNAQKGIEMSLKAQKNNSSAVFGK